MPSPGIHASPRRCWRVLLDFEGAGLHSSPADAPGTAPLSTLLLTGRVALRRWRPRARPPACKDRSHLKLRLGSGSLSLCFLFRFSTTFTFPLRQNSPPSRKTLQAVSPWLGVVSGTKAVTTMAQERPGTGSLQGPQLVTRARSPECAPSPGPAGGWRAPAQRAPSCARAARAAAASRRRPRPRRGGLQGQADARGSVLGVRARTRRPPPPARSPPAQPSAAGPLPHARASASSPSALFLLDADDLGGLSA